MGAPDVKHRGRTVRVVEIRVQVPTNLSDDERDAMTKLREADTRDYREGQPLQGDVLGRLCCFSASAGL